MVSNKRVNRKGNIYWFSQPHHRDQDYISVKESLVNCQVSIGVVDGWHNKKFIPGNAEGRQAAKLVADYFPKIFLESEQKNWQSTAQKAANKTHAEIIRRYPKHVSCVGSFLFRYTNHTILCSIGTINVYVKRNNKWVKPRSIHNNWLDWQTNESGSATFLGRGELAGNKKYSQAIDCIKILNNEMVLIMTDGADELMEKKSLNFSLKGISDSEEIISKLYNAILKKRNKQIDDISVLLLGAE